jgi:hypothetical protein
MDMFKGIKIIIQDDDFKVGIRLLNCLTGFFSRENHVDFGFWILDFGLKFWILDWGLGIGDWELGEVQILLTVAKRETWLSNQNPQSAIQNPKSKITSTLPNYYSKLKY